MAYVKRTRDFGVSHSRQIVLQVPRDRDFEELVDMDPDEVGMCLELGIYCLQVCKSVYHKRDEMEELVKQQAAFDIVKKRYESEREAFQYQLVVKDETLARARQQVDAKSLELKELSDVLALKHRQEMLEYENLLKNERNALAIELAEARDYIARAKKYFDDALGAKSLELIYTREALHYEFLSKQQQLHYLFYQQRVEIEREFKISSDLRMYSYYHAHERVLESKDYYILLMKQQHAEYMHRMEEQNRHSFSIGYSTYNQFSTLTEKLDYMSGLMQYQVERSIVSKHNSSVKGKLFEQQLMDDVYSMFRVIGDFSFVDTSKMAASGDFVTIYDGVSIMWEAKSYSKTVEAREVTKFLRDLHNRRDVSVGVFVSSSSAVSDGKQVYSYIHSFENEKKLVVIVPCYEVFYSHTLAIVKMIVDVWNKKQSRYSISEYNYDAVVKTSYKLLEQCQANIENVLYQKYKILKWFDDYLDALGRERADLVYQIRLLNGEVAYPVVLLPSYSVQEPSRAVVAEASRAIVAYSSGAVVLERVVAERVEVRSCDASVASPLKYEFYTSADSCTIPGYIIIMISKHMYQKADFSMYLFQAVNEITYALKISYKMAKKILLYVLRSELIDKQGYLYLIKGFEWK